MRIAILGNSGSGKSTLSRWLARRGEALHLDLDTVAWEPGEVAVERARDAAEAEVERFCAEHERWVVEGCYANLVRVALQFEPLFLLLDPGQEACLDNCRARPWEKHKYSSKEEQDERLPFLLSWVSEYYSRSGELSLREHLACFQEYEGPKVEVTDVPQLEPPSREVLAWLAGDVGNIGNGGAGEDHVRPGSLHLSKA